jgi:diguanylate cyclase (GGDEF)-like protein
VIVGLLVVAEYIAKDVMIRWEVHQTNLIAAAGRQRMQVQRAAVLAQEMALTVSVTRRDSLRHELRSVVSSFERIHQDLVHDPESAILRTASAEARRILLQPEAGLEGRTHDFLEAAHELASRPVTAELSPNDEALRRVVQASADVPIVVDALLTRLMAEADGQAARGRRVGLALLVATLLVLGLIGGLLLEPMSRRMQRNTRQLEEANLQLKRLSFLDGLTGIPNRRAFEERFQLEWRRAMRHGSSIAVLMIDIDHFKEYNDHYGHQRGDDCLFQLAQRLRNSISRPGDFVARYGGEEFAIILPDTELEGARAVAENVRRRVAGLRIPHSTSPVREMVTISVGAAAVVPDAASPAPVAAADHALYRAKQLGRNRVEVAGGEGARERRSVGT